MRITLAQIEAFHSVARLGTVHEASRQLNLAQPTVSLRLRDLEQALGLQLFERKGRGLQLTQEGREMVEHAQAILGEIGKLKGRVDHQEIGGLVRLGVSESFAVSGLPALLKLASQEYPALRVELVIGPSPDLVADLADHRLDLAIAINPADDPRLQIVPFGVQPATWVAAPALNLPALVRPADLLHHTVLVSPSPSPNWRQTMSWFGAAGLEPLHLSKCHTVPSVIAHLVEAGLGVAILPSRLIEASVRMGTLIALESRPQIEKSFLCAVRRADDRDLGLDALIAVTRRVLADLDLLETN
ncbi:LysR family transcriptional regulator [Jiella sonneratiae]|uniref:LysR family transcriptional regulator n=1 Tax=Jiella sonneratiae TaxID=2816856 RepID=A0ABS3JAW1_9HYPH|nr:LysR family transcriptional regulator [Jiella sonneratiae]MBO0906098.1 LysR family transcriptional regulator [Jiella sonneratiae]